MNTQVKTWVGTVVIIIIAVTTGVFVWQYERTQPEIAPMQIKIPVKQKDVKTVGKEAKSNINFSKIQFDACGKIDKYNKLAWWDNFKTKAMQASFYSDYYIWGQMHPNENEYYSNYEDYCKNNANMDICIDGKDKKLTEDVFNELEGCMSLDGSVFIAVVPGVYLGGGNQIFRYDIKNNILDKAKRVNEERGNIWFAVPREFLKREGSIIKMLGREGDAGAGTENTFNYDFVKNEVKLIKSCNIGEGAKPGDCTNY